VDDEMQTKRVQEGGHGDKEVDIDDGDEELEVEEVEVMIRTNR
jgi:hypothetical protein